MNYYDCAGAGKMVEPRIPRLHPWGVSKSFRREKYVMAKYHYLIVGAGLFGSVFAQQATEKGRRCLVIDRRNTVGGNLHCQEIEGILVYRYGPHIFHTYDWGVWEYVNRFARFNHFINEPIAVYKNQLYNLPINMNTFYKLWGVRTPAEAQAKIQQQAAKENIGDPQNLEEQALKMVGRDVYEILLKGYLEKQRRQSARDLPASLIRNLTVRYTYDNRFFPDPYQGVPIEGYDVMIKRMLAGCEVRLGTEYMGFGRANAGIADKTLFTGMIDEFFRFRLGALDYRTLSYETEVLDCPNWQGCAIAKYTDPDVPYTRVIEHKHFVFGDQPKTVISREFSTPWRSDMEPYYPTDDAKNRKLYKSYRALSVTQPDVIFGGRLGSYRYYDMDQTVRAALDLAAQMMP